MARSLTAFVSETMFDFISQQRNHNNDLGSRALALVWHLAKSSDSLSLFSLCPGAASCFA